MAPSPFMLLAALGEPVIRKYHVSRIGRVKADNVFGKYAWLTGAAYGLFSIVDSNFRGQGVPSVAILVWAIVPIRDVVGGWPYRNYHIVNVVSLLLGSLLHVSVRSQDDQAVWFAQLTMIWGIAHVITGFRDHQLLSSVMPEMHETEETA